MKIFEDDFVLNFSLAFNQKISNVSAVSLFSSLLPTSLTLADPPSVLLFNERKFKKASHSFLLMNI
jgi:hypothetical protein